MEHCSNNGMLQRVGWLPLHLCFFCGVSSHILALSAKTCRNPMEILVSCCIQVYIGSKRSMQQFTSRLRHCTTARSQFAWESVCKLSCLLGHRWSLKIKWIGGNFWEKSNVCFLLFQIIWNQKNEWLTPYISIYTLYMFFIFFRWFIAPKSDHFEPLKGCELRRFFNGQLAWNVQFEAGQMRGCELAGMYTYIV